MDFGRFFRAIRPRSFSTGTGSHEPMPVDVETVGDSGTSGEEEGPRDPRLRGTTTPLCPSADARHAVEVEKQAGLMTLVASDSPRAVTDSTAHMDVVESAELTPALVRDIDDEGKSVGDGETRKPKKTIGNRTVKRNAIAPSETIADTEKAPVKRAVKRSRSGKFAKSSKSRSTTAIDDITPSATIADPSAESRSTTPPGTERNRDAHRKSTL
jgi:hypothetical protein